ncbi:MAG TPA: PadR family transcriptional regulator [Candidatus Methanomethylicus sp.]|nr:PadR family transcriptional regulator [Candidatus Methanomethylicus sp.]HRR54778.1 PadR family transcriptional regulator [Candidatus Methanomethylicus sp.]HRU81197.1 PadR family transcriptional regulator [Candidatus Methanomethylicus sp.]
MCDCEQECDCEDGRNCGEDGDCEPEGNCCHRSAQLRGVMHIAILSLLKRKDTHGSDLCLSIKDRFGMDIAKPAVYMALRRMERHGLLVSHWDMEGSGPARRVYRITEDGIDYLNESIGELKRMADVIERMIEECGKQPGA